MLCESTRRYGPAENETARMPTKKRKKKSAPSSGSVFSTSALSSPSLSLSSSPSLSLPLPSLLALPDSCFVSHIRAVASPDLSTGRRQRPRRASQPMRTCVPEHRAPAQRQAEAAEQNPQAKLRNTPRGEYCRVARMPSAREHLPASSKQETGHKYEVW